MNTDKEILSKMFFGEDILEDIKYIISIDSLTDYEDLLDGKKSLVFEFNKKINDNLCLSKSILKNLDSTELTKKHKFGIKTEFNQNSLCPSGSGYENYNNRILNNEYMISNLIFDSLDDIISEENIIDININLMSQTNILNQNKDLKHQSCLIQQSCVKKKIAYSSNNLIDIIVKNTYTEYEKLECKLDYLKTMIYESNESIGFNSIDKLSDKLNKFLISNDNIVNYIINFLNKLKKSKDKKYILLFYLIYIVIKIKNFQIINAEEELKNCYDIDFTDVNSFSSKNINLIDNFGLFKDTKKFDKTLQNYDKITNFLLSTDLNSKFKTNEIPKDLLFSKNQIVDIIIKQIKTVNQNKSYDHFIEHDKDFTFVMNLFFDNMNNLSDNPDVKIQLDIDPILYPFYPIKFKILYPDVSLSLFYSILNLKITKLCNWNPTINLEWLTLKFYDNLGKINFSNKNNSISDLEKVCIDICILENKTIDDEFKFNFDYSKYDITVDNENDEKYWQSGVGYGYTGRKSWNISDFVENHESLNRLKVDKLEKIFKILEIEYNHVVQCNVESNDNNSYRKNILSPFSKKEESKYVDILFDFIFDSFKNSTILEIEKGLDVFVKIAQVTEKIFNFHSNDLNYLRKWKIELGKNIEVIKNEISLILESVEDDKQLNTYIQIISLYDKIKDHLEELIKVESEIDAENLGSNFLVSDIDSTLLNLFNDKSNIKKFYELLVELIQKNIVDNTWEPDEKHRFKEEKNKVIKPKSILRITTEVISLKSNLPNNWDTNIIMKTSKNFINIFTFLITGPKDTPYHNGIFEFHGSFPDDYPNVEPKVLIDTTGNGDVRFNPNLYACGKVCLSLLGTWNGNGAEKWNFSTSTFLQVLVSIQSLIFVDSPYFNEPGWEKQMHSLEGKRKSFDYNDNLRVQTLKWAILDKFKNPPIGYEVFTRFHFLTKKKEILEVVREWLEESQNSNKNKIAKLRIELINYYKKINNDEFVDELYQYLFDLDLLEKLSCLLKENFDVEMDLKEKILFKKLILKVVFNKDLSNENSDDDSSEKEIKEKLDNNQVEDVISLSDTESEENSSLLNDKLSNIPILKQSTLGYELLNDYDEAVTLSDSSESNSYDSPNKNTINIPLVKLGKLNTVLEESIFDSSNVESSDEEI